MTKTVIRNHTKPTTTTTGVQLQSFKEKFKTNKRKKIFSNKQTSVLLTQTHTVKTADN